jgi:outer membrane protein OmpA-like peptidoglycan-associated protein
MTMRASIRLTAAATAAGLALAGCAMRGAPPPPPPPAFTALGVSAPYLNGELIGGNRARAAKMRAAKIRPLAPGAASAYSAATAAELRRQTAGIGLDVLTLPGGVVIRIPATLTFNSGSAEIAPQIRATLRELARTMKTQSQTYVDVYAHTDTTGSPQVNKTLSERRASAVAAYFAGDGVARARIASRGFGESAPLYNPETSETEKAANRRVEIRLVPYTG